jgi:hypothetical protein
MTPRKRVEIALHGGHSDKVPFTIYEAKIPQCVTERLMRNRGLCIVKRDVSAVAASAIRHRNLAYLFGWRLKPRQQSRETRLRGLF